METYIKNFGNFLLENFRSKIKRKSMHENENVTYRHPQDPEEDDTAWRDLHPYHHVF